MMIRPRQELGPQHSEQEEQNPDQRMRTNRPGKDRDNRRSLQQTERRRERSEPEAVDGEGETESESAKQ
jgi:hypothetical protein